MIFKRVIADVAGRQRQAAEHRPQGVARQIATELPYLDDRALLIGGVRGCGRSTLLLQLFQNDYPQAWYMDFADPRLAGFDRADFEKLIQLVRESGKGILLLDKVDEAQGWQEFISGRLDDRMKVVATVSFDTWLRLSRWQLSLRNAREGGAATVPFTPLRERSSVATPLGRTWSEEAFGERVILFRLGLFRYVEFLEATHKYGGEEAVQEYLFRGGFPEPCRTGKLGSLSAIYELILNRDILIAKGVRDRSTLCRIALNLLSSSGCGVTANALRGELQVKAVTTVTEHMDHLERAGMVAFVPILSSVGSRRSVHPRRVYAVDTAFAEALSIAGPIPKERLFATLVFNTLAERYERICYLPEQGGCDFVCLEENRVVACVQACYDGEDPDQMERKVTGLIAALHRTGVRRGSIITLGRSERQTVDQVELEIVDADTFLSR